MRSFYDSNINNSSNTHTLSEEESKHIIRSLRMANGDSLIVLDGKGNSFECEIKNDHPKKCELEIVKVNQTSEPKFEIHIAVAPTKQTERIEWFIEKATEIGLTEFTPIQCSNSERSKIKTERLTKKAISAMKQSQRLFLPKINELSDIKTFISNHPNGLIAHCYDTERSSLSKSFKAINCPIIIGPEGDFTKEEIDFALENGYKTITLGDNRLRTETAALYSCMQAKMMSE